MPLLTIFTPAYNRAHTISRTYQSLLAQDCRDFTWLVVDDGSTDHTAELVRQWQSQDNGFEIRYIYKENGGMHTAHNVAYANIHTELNVCIDSDDALAEGAVKHIVNVWSRIDTQKYAGIVGLDADMNTGKVIGTSFPKEMEETTLHGFYASGGRGDKKLVYRTDLMQALPDYPVFPGEKYVSLGWKYQLCDQIRPLVTTNQVLCNVEYQADGSSKNMFRQYLRNPKGFAFIRKENMKYHTDWKENFKDNIHYVSSSILAKNRHFVGESPMKAMTMSAIPFGVALTAYIKWKAR